MQAGPLVGGATASAAAAAGTAQRKPKEKASVVYPRSARPLIDIGANLTDKAFRHDILVTENMVDGHYFRVHVTDPYHPVALDAIP